MLFTDEFLLSTERGLILAILRKAYEDLDPHAPPADRTVSVQFFANQDRHLECLCEMVDLDYEAVQDAVSASYPALFARQGSPCRSTAPGIAS